VNLKTLPRPILTPEQARASAAALPPDEAARWVERLDELRDDCGCAVGARFFFATLLAYPAAWYLLLRAALPTPWHAVPAGLVLLFLAAGLGKLTGVLIARRRLRLATLSLQARLAGRTEGLHA
jgi:VIT1/CCC1 family predicted Fe2+/Mn2+ transporter